MLASSYPILDVFLTMLYFFLFIIWIWLLIMVFIDIFRSHDMGGWAKALWVIFIIILPFLGVFVYLIARGGKMHERAAAEAAQQQKAFDSVRQAGGGHRAATTHAPTSSRSWPTSSRRACSPTPSSRPRRPRSWPAEHGGGSTHRTVDQSNEEKRRHHDHRTSQLHGDRLSRQSFNGNIAPEVAKLVANGTVRILDLVFVAKDEQGDTISLEFDQMDELAAFGDIDGEVGGLVNEEDLDHVAADLPPGNAALVILWEDLWAVPLVEAVRESGGVRRRQRPHPGRPRRGRLGRAGRGAEELSHRQRDRTNERRSTERCQ